jgi:hypothetical protein
MVDQEEKIIWFIDNDESQLDRYHRQLQRGLNSLIENDEVNIVDVLAKPHKEDYLEFLEDSRTASILIDQKLEDKGGVDHTGIELAQYLRTINDIIPIYILTNYPSIDEYSEGEWSVEDIISKSSLATDDKRKAIISRILRRINVHQKVYGEREIRFRELLKKSLKEELLGKEKEELERLEFSRSASTIAHEHLLAIRPNQMDEVLHQLQELKEMVKTLNAEDED